MDLSSALYLTDSYLVDFDATVAGAEESAVRLDRTAFYPTGGGQPGDTGRLRLPDGTSLTVETTEKSDAGIRHRLPTGSVLPPVGTRVHGTVDWDRRYRHMRYHTMLHLLSRLVLSRFGSGITGSQIYDDRARMDFSLPEFGRPLAEDLLRELNETSRRGLDVTIRFVDRGELKRDPALVRVAEELLPNEPTIRLVDIGGFDVQADGGTHVRSSLELGPAHLEKIENKGARNKRLYLALLPDAPPLPVAPGTGERSLVPPGPQA